MSSACFGKFAGLILFTMQGAHYGHLHDKSITHLESHLLDFHRAIPKETYLSLIARQADVTVDSDSAFFSFNQRVLNLFPEHVFFFSDSNGRRCCLTDCFFSGLRAMKMALTSFKMWEDVEIYENLHPTAVEQQQASQILHQLVKHTFREFVFVFRFSF